MSLRDDYMAAMDYWNPSIRVGERVQKGPFKFPIGALVIPVQEACRKDCPWVIVKQEYVLSGSGAFYITRTTRGEKFCAGETGLMLAQPMMWDQETI